MKIAIVGLRGIPTSYGGIERHVEAIAPRLAARGHEVTVYGNSLHCVSGLYGKVQVRSMPTLRTKHLETAVYALLASLDVLRRDHDVLHYHGLGPSLFSILPKLARRRIVTTVHGLDWRRAKWGVVARLALRAGEYASFRVPDATTVVSRALHAHYLSEHRTQTEMIPNGVEMPGESGSELIGPLFGLNPREYILWLGRLVPEKGLHYLVPAYRRLETNAKLVIAGELSHASSYVRRVRELADGDERIRFVGFVKERPLQQLLANASVFVLPSDLEGLSIALLEAMSFGLPVVVSDLPENLEVIENPRLGRAGLSFPQADPEALAARLAEVLESPDLARELGAKARQVVEEDFSWDAAVNRLERLYERVVIG